MLKFVLLVCVSSLCGAFMRTKHNNNHHNQYNRLSALSTSSKGTKIAPEVVESVSNWLVLQPLESIVSPEDLKKCAEELNANDRYWQQNRPLFEKYWDRLEDTLRTEKRSLRQVLGEKTINNLLTRVEAWDIYEPTTVRAFLQNAAFEDMIGGILYEGIFMFIQKVDIIGNIIDKIPVLGPVRKIVMTEFKSSLDKTVGGQVKAFLSTFNRIAVERMIEYVLNAKNRSALQKANGAVARSLFDRPLASIAPGKDTSILLRDQLWNLLRDVPPSEIITLTETMYERVASKSIQDFGDAQQLLDAVPTFRKVLEDNTARFFETTEGANLLKDMAIVALNED